MLINIKNYLIICQTHQKQIILYYQYVMFFKLINIKIIILHNDFYFSKNYTNS